MQSTDFMAHYRSDLRAGFAIFMIALPLSIGIAVASGVPATAGILAAIIGGMVGSLWGGSRLAINGPAAGLIVIVFAAVQELGAGDPLQGFRLALDCIVVAGLLQIAMGALRLGTLGLMFPVTVVHGMLAAIGLIIIAKQMHVALGIREVSGTPLENFLQLPESLLHLNPAISLIAGAALATMLLWTRCGKKIHGILPAPLAAVVVGAGLGIYFDLEHPHLIEPLAKAAVGPEFLLNVPASLASAIHLPDFSKFSTLLFWKHVLMITLVATAESILSTCAVDKLDPEHRRTDLNRDLVGKGIVNIGAGSLGGLPIITEIVRSSANIAGGAKTKLANFSHGFFLFLFLATVPNLLHLIPVAALAAILLVVGYRLAAPRHFIHGIQESLAQGLVFILTVITVLATDLLLGVIVGTILEFIILAASSQTLNLFRLDHEKRESAGEPVVRVNGPVGFTNYLQLRRYLDTRGTAKSLTLDLRRSRVVDPTVKDHLDNHMADFAAAGKTLIVRRLNPQTARLTHGQNHSMN